MSETPAPPTLSYATKPRFTWGVRRTVVLIAFFPALFAATYFGRSWIDETRRVYWQWRHLHYSPSPDTVVYEEDPAHFPALLAKSDYVQDNAPKAPGTWSPVHYTPPFLWDWLAPPETIIFEHAITLQSGKQSLGYVYLREMPAVGTARGLGFTTYLDDVRPWGESKRIIRSIWTTGIQLAPTDRLRLFAGQPDPANPHRLTIRYELNSKPGTLEAITDDHNDLDVRILDGPLQYGPPI